MTRPRDESEVSFPHIPSPRRIYPNLAGTPYIKESFYLSSPKHLYGFAPRGFCLASPPSLSEETKRAWREEAGKRISSPDTFAQRFVSTVDEMRKKAEEHRKKALGY